MNVHSDLPSVVWDNILTGNQPTLRYDLRGFCRLPLYGYTYSDRYDVTSPWVKNEIQYAANAVMIICQPASGIPDTDFDRQRVPDGEMFFQTHLPYRVFRWDYKPEKGRARVWFGRMKFNARYIDMIHRLGNIHHWGVSKNALVIYGDGFKALLLRILD